MVGAGGGVLLLAVEAAAACALAVAVVKWDALLGSSEEQLQSGIRPTEQVIWNVQKVFRCALFVLCFSKAFLLRAQDRASRWSLWVFGHVAQQLWLVDDGESGPYLLRQRACLALAVVVRAALGSAKSWFRLQAEGGGEGSVCSGTAAGWAILLLDVFANSGFVAGFLAGRLYLRAAAEARGVRLDEDKEALLRRPARRSAAGGGPWWKAAVTRPEVAPTGEACVGAAADEKPPPAAADGAGDSEEVAAESPSLSPPAASDGRRFEDVFLERGPTFGHYAQLAFAGFAAASLLECYLLRHWELGILGAREDDVDVFHYSAPYFVTYTPDFSLWHAKRALCGSWRDIIYLLFVHPKECCSAAAAMLVVHAISVKLSWRRAQEMVRRTVVGALTYAAFVSAHRAYFAMVCLLVCWECRVLEVKCLRFARAFVQLTPHQRWRWHAELGDEIKVLDKRIAPLIVYAFLQRLAYLALDLTRQSCESALPFNLVHYLFRHVMFLAALCVTFWRIGKLNFAYYEKLHNAVMDAFPHNWADIGEPGVTQNHVVLQRMHLDDWRQYVMHNIDSGRREACIRIFYLRWAAKSHVLALSVLTIFTLPVINKVMDTYGRHIVNERLLSSAPPAPSPLAAAAALAEKGFCAMAEAPAAAAGG